MVLSRTRARGLELETSLERALAGVAPRSSYRERIEQYFITAFKRQSHRDLVQHKLSRDSLLELVAVMQHWGVPTRLLDFTTSFYVATYFALSGLISEQTQEGEGAAVWAVAHIPLRAISTMVLQSYGKIAADASHLDLSPEEFFEAAFYPEKDQKRMHFVSPVQPFFYNERAASQQGVFLCPSNVMESFEQNLFFQVIAGKERHCLTPDKLFDRIVIPKSIAAESLQELAAMNITAASLFPGIGGYASFLKETVTILKAEKALDWIIRFEALERLGWPN